MSDTEEFGGQNSSPNVQYSPQNNQKENDKERQAGWKDLLGLVSTSAAIFYFAGWVYETNWYSYFGLDISQVQLTSAQIMVQGVPGIFLLAACIVSAIVFLFTARFIFKVQSTFSENFLFTVIVAYLIALVVLTIFYLSNSSAFGTLPREVLVLIITSASIFFIIFLGMGFVSSIEQMRHMFLTIQMFWNLLWKGLIFYRRTRNRKLDKDLVDYELQEIRKIPEEYEKRYAQLVEQYQLQLSGLWSSVINSRELWLIVFVVLLFLVSVAFSAMLGITDARNGRRSLSANWRLHKTYIFSESPIQVLAGYECTRTVYDIKSTDSNSEFICVQEQEDKTIKGDRSELIYGPFGLITSNSNNWYLTEWSKIIFQQQSKLFVVPRLPEKQSLYFAPPTATPTPKPTPTYKSTPLLTPTTNRIPPVSRSVGVIFVTVTVTADTNGGLP